MMNVITTASAARPVNHRSRLPKPRSAPVPGRRPHPAKSRFFEPTNLGVSPCRPGPLTRRRPTWDSGIVERLTIILPLPKGEGRGEGEAPKRMPGALKPLCFLSNQVWFVGSNVKSPANEGLYPLANDPFLLTFPVGQASSPAGCHTVPVPASFCPDSKLQTLSPAPRTVSQWLIPFAPSRLAPSGQDRLCVKSRSGSIRANPAYSG